MKGYKKKPTILNDVHVFDKILDYIYIYNVMFIFFESQIYAVL